jgi:hypothetical protein
VALSSRGHDSVRRHRLATADADAPRTAHQPAAAGRVREAAAAACSCGFGDGAYVTYSPTAPLTIDGTFTDWNAVLADTDNGACDLADGSGDPDSASTNNGGRDLLWFSQTWDDTNVYLFTERQAGNSAQQQFLYYADLDSDGYMETGEYVINASWSNSGTSLTRYTYTQTVVGGDPMTNISGSADGYTLPGSLGSSAAIASSASATNGSTRLEFSVPWSAFGVPAGTGVTFHVSTMNGAINGSNPPGGVNDNMSGCGGGLGGTKFASFSFTPDRSVTALHNTGQPVPPYSKRFCAAHVFTNTANDDDTFNVTYSAPPSWVTSVELYSDLGTVGTYDVGVDTLLTDGTDTGSTVDTGPVAVLASKNLLVCYIVNFTNAYTPIASGAVTITATSAWNSAVYHAVVDTITAPGVVDPVFTKSSAAVSDPVNGVSANAKRIPGGFVDYTVTLTNYGGRAIDASTIAISDLIGSSMALFVNTLGGTPAGPVAQTNGTLACGLTAASLTTLYSKTVGVTVTDPDTSYAASVTADGNGVDSAVTAIRIKPSGTFVGITGATAPSCSWRFRARVR